MSALGPYALIVVVVLAVLAIGCLLALLSANGEDVPCDGWVIDADHAPNGDARAAMPAPCPGRKPCPLHDREDWHRH